MGVRLKFNFEGETQLSRHLALVEEALGDWTPAFQTTTEYLIEVFSTDVFEGEGAIIEEHWAPLSRAYAWQKQKMYPGKGILERTGAMKAQFSATYGPKFASITNTADYFKYHQSNQPRSKIPRRVMMKLAGEQRESIMRVFTAYFQNLLVGGGSTLK